MGVETGPVGYISDTGFLLALERNQASVLQANTELCSFLFDVNVLPFGCTACQF